MDQPPNPKPPARIKQSNGPVQLPATVLAPGLLPVPATSVENARTTKAHMIECWVLNQGLPVTASTSGSFTQNQISDWLKAPSLATEDGLKPTAGLRLVCWEQTDSMKWPFDKATFEAIQDTLGLPKTYTYLHMPKSGACGRYLGLPYQPIFIYHRSNNNGTISAVLKYDSATNITTGYALLGPRISLGDVCTKIRLQFPEFPHPLLIPTVLIELTATDLMRELYHIHRLLTASESKTQSGDWEIQDSLANTDSGAVLKAPGQPHRALAPEDWWSDESAVEMQQEPSYWATMSKEMNACHDNHQLARILGWLSCRFAFMNAAVQCSISMIDFTMQELDLMKDYSTHSNRHKMKKIMNSACLKHRLEFLNSNLRHMAVFGAIGPRMHTQQTVLFNLINIGMARDSKEVAEASKRDSSAMKIIAVLTTLFLPGTFIATFFAMPILNWNALSMSDVMTNHFWLYWAVAVPLTVLVMTIVAAYGFGQAREKQKAAEKARNSAGFRGV